MSKKLFITLIVVNVQRIMPLRTVDMIEIQADTFQVVASGLRCSG